jgi:hypothetical protein
LSWLLPSVQSRCTRQAHGINLIFHRVYKQFTFRWTADVTAVVHTHANGDNPEPVGQDLKLADRFGIPVFTITQFGMYLYDPDTRKTTLVQQGLDWLNSKKWNRDRQPVAQSKWCVSVIMISARCLPITTSGEAV